MSYLKEAALGFVDGNVQKQILYTFQVLDKFVKRFGPELEEVNAEFILLGKKQLVNINKKDIMNFTLRDLKQGKQALQWYSVIMNALGNRIALLSSNYGLFEFLREANISPQYLTDVQNEINAYWKITYLPLVLKLKLIFANLQVLNQVLEQQIKILEHLPQSDYYQGLDDWNEITRLFEIERTTFWELVKNLEVSKKEFGDTTLLFSVELEKLKQLARAHLKLLKFGLKEEIVTSEGNLRKSLVIFLYVAGATLLYFNLKNIIFKEGLKGLFGFLKSKKENNISNVANKLKDLQKEEMFGFGEGILKTILGL